MSQNNDAGFVAAAERQSPMAGKSDFIIVTERGGEPVSHAQLERFHQRYVWAGNQSVGKDVLELACGTGPGLGYIASRSRSLRAGDVDAQVLGIARRNYGNRIELGHFDAAGTPFPDESLDLIILFEAIYYLPDVDAFVAEVWRLLRPGGKLLIATANKDLFDFNPSPFSQQYFNPPELAALLGGAGFATSFFGGSPVPADGPAFRLVRMAKRIAVALHLIPRSMRAKRLLKRLVFGKLVIMPRELCGNELPYVPPSPIRADVPDTVHQVLYCVAEKVLP